MNDSHEQWVAELLAQDTRNSQQRQAYEQGLASMRQAQAGRGEQAWHAGLSVLGAIGGLAVATLALTEPATTPWTTRAILFGLSVFPLSWSILFGVAFIRRWPRSGAQRTAVARLALGCTSAALVLIGLIVALSGAPAGSAGLLGVAGLLVLLAGMGVLLDRIQQAESRLRLDLLSLELRLNRANSSGPQL